MKTNSINSGFSVVNIQTKRGNLIEPSDYLRQYSSAIPIMARAREDLEISMNNKKSGFYYNPLNLPENILKDLEFVFECLKQVKNSDL